MALQEINIQSRTVQGSKRNGQPSGGTTLVTGGTGNVQIDFPALFAEEMSRWFVRDTENKALRPADVGEEAYGLYSNSYISAKGANDDAGGTVSGVTELSKLSDVQLGTLADGQVLTWDVSSQKWVNKTLETGLDETALADYLTSNQYVTQQWVTGALDQYVTTEDLTEAVAEAVSAALAGKVDTSFFARLLAAIAGDGTEISVNDMETVIASVKVKFGLWSGSWISAKGQNPDAGGTVSGATDLDGLSDVTLTNLQNGQVLMYNGSQWVNSTLDVGLDETALAQYLTSHLYATQSWVTSQNYATEDDLDARIDALVNGAPAAFDTLKEIADVLQGNVDSIGDILTALGNKADKTITITAGAGLTGGGNLSANRTISLATVGTAGTYTKVTVDAYGRVTGHSSLVEGDIPALGISKITGLQTALDAKLDAASFNDLFEKVEISTGGYAIRAKYGLYSNDWISTKGANPDAGGVVSGASKLTELEDVSVSSVANGQVLTWDVSSKKWVNKTIEAGLDTAELEEYLTSHDYAKKSDIPALTGYATQEWVNTKLGSYATTSAMNSALGNKVDKVAGKGLSSNDFTDALLTKLNGIEEGANKYVLPTATGSVLGGVKVGATLAIASGVLNMKAVGTAGTYTKVTVDAYGRVTGHASLAATDIPNLPWSKITSGKPTTLAGYGITDAYTKTETDDRYVNITGDTMTGLLTANAGVSATFVQIGSGRIKWDSSNNALYVEKSDGTAIGFYSKGFMSAKGANDDAGGTVSGVTALSQLSDVILGTLANGQALVWDSTLQKWVNKTIENGLDETALAQYLTNNGYATQGWATSQFAYKTGTNASGTWPISVTGQAGRLSSTYTGSGGNQPPSYFNGMGLKVNMMSVPVQYSDVIVVNGYGGTGADVPYINAIAFQKTANAHGEVYHARAGYGASSWGTWYKFLDEYNYTSILDSRYLRTVSLATISDLHSSWDAVLKAQKPAWLTTVSLATISDLHASWDALLKTAPSVYVTRWPTAAEVGALTQTSADARYLLKSAYTAADVLAKLKTVDGSGSGLDADTLDGYHLSNIETGGWTSFNSYVYDETNGTRYYCYRIGNLNNEGSVTLRVRALDDINYPSYNEWELRMNFSTGFGKNVTLVPQTPNQSNLVVYVDSSNYVWFKCDVTWSHTFQYKIEENTGSILITSGVSKVETTPSNVSYTITNFGSCRNNVKSQTFAHYSDIYNATTSVKIGSGTISWDATNNCFHFSHGLYSDSFVSAKGANSGSGGTVSGVTELSKLSDVQLGTLATNQVLSWNGSKWVNKAISTGLDETALAQYLTNNQYLTMPTGDGRYVTINTDQTITGKKTFTNSLSFKYDTDTSRVYGINFNDTSNEIMGSIGYLNVSKFFYINPIGSSNPWQDSVGKYNLIIGNNKLTYNTYPILTSNNYTSYIGNSFVKKSGDTMTGTLTVPSLVVSGSTATVSGNKVWHAGNDGSGSGLDADLLDGLQYTSFESYRVVQINASSLNQNTWYPVTMAIGNSQQTRIRIEGNTSANASWNPRADKYMSLILDYTVNGSMWGWTSAQRVIYQYMEGAGASACLRGLGQLTNSSTEYVFVRGGAVYNFYVSRFITPVLRTSTYTVSEQSVSPTTTAPAAISRTNALITDNVYSATQLQTARTINGTAFNGTSNIVTSYWGTARTLSLTGNATGSVSMNGSSNVSMSVNVNYATSAGNADTLDRLQATAFFRCIGNNTHANWNDMTELGTMRVSEQSITNGPAGAYNYGQLVTFNAQGTLTQLYFPHSTAAAYIRTGWSGVSQYYSWLKLATVNDNVASASKLQTARSIWGRPFDGTANVSGNMTGVGSISASGNITTDNALFQIDATNISGDRGLNVLYNGQRLFCGFGTSGSKGLYIAHSGSSPGWVLSVPSSTVVAIAQNSGINVGIGTTSPSYKLHVAGDIYATSWLRTNGQTGWYSQTYGGGWYMTDTTWLRAYNGKSIYTSGRIQTDTSFDSAGSVVLRRLGYTNSNLITWEWTSTYGDAVNFYIPGTNNQSVSMKLYSVGGLLMNGLIHATGGIYSDSYVSAKGNNSSSDIRLKNILCPVRPSLEAFAKAPLFRFAWKSNPGMVEIGSSAQYWKNVLPDTVKERDGWLEMGYGNIALAGVITIARDFETLEQRVDRLEKENGKLKKRIKELERRTI